jgi:hypothetical protein
LKPNQKLITKEGLWKFYSCDYPTVGYVAKSYFEKNKTTNVTYQNTLVKLTEGIESLRKLGMDISDIKVLLDGTTATKTAQEAGPAKCPPPTIIDFNPKSAFTGDTAPTITITGTFLYGSTQVFLNGVAGTVKSNTNTETIVQFVPKGKKTGKIKVKTEYGESKETTEDFVFLTEKP